MITFLICIMIALGGGRYQCTCQQTDGSVKVPKNAKAFTPPLNRDRRSRLTDY